MRKKRHSCAFLLATALGLLAGEVRADYKDEIGYTDLQALLGPATPSGAGVTVTQVEGLDNDDNYFPDTNVQQFAGMDISDVTGSSTGTSSHATTVGKFFYGSSDSIAPAIDTADVYEAGDWLAGGFLKTGGIFNGEPLTETRDVQNHSWIGTGSTQATNSTRRLDFAIRRDGFTCVVGLNNGAGTSVPLLLGQSYNAISVGRSDGSHSRGGTTFEEPGRVKPELVVPLSATSWSTPVVGSAAALLIETARSDPAWSEAERPETIKALLMAGATKDEWVSWDRTPARPLDEVYGAGELNIYNSYLMLTRGPQSDGAGTLVDASGWARDVQPVGAVRRYFFEVPAGRRVPELSVILVWNRHIVDGNSRPTRWDPLPEMPDMTLTLRAADGFTPGAIVDLSTSAVDNVEHVVQHDLLPGNYVIEVSTDMETEFALAWRGDPEIQVPVLAGIAVEGGGTARLTVDGVPHTDYALEYAPEPVPTWTPLVTNTPAASPFDMLDPGAGGDPGRVYRVRMLGVD